MKYIKLLGHYYKDGYFGNSSDGFRPIIYDITLGHPGTIRIHSDQDDTLYVCHDALSNTPEYIKKIFEDTTYTDGAVVYNALNNLDLDYPDEAEVIVIPRTNYKINGSNEIHYDIYWPYDYDTDPISIYERGTIYDSKEIPTYPLYTAIKSGTAITKDEIAGLTFDHLADASYFNSSAYISDICGSIDFGASGWENASSLFTDSNWTFKFIDKEQTKGKEKENMNLNNLFGNLKVGKAGRDYAITYYGTVSYKGKTYYQGQIYEVDGLTLPLDYLFFVPSNTVTVGDIISKNDTAYHVTKVTKTGVEAINLETGTVENLLAGGPFGMTMYSKLFNPMGNMVNGNIGNLLLMQSLMGDNKGGDNSLLMAMMFMGNSGFNFKLPDFTAPQAPAQEVKGSVTPTLVAREVVEN